MDSRVVLVTRLKSSLGVAGEHDGMAVADVRHPDAVESTLRSVHASGAVPIVVCRTAELEEVRQIVTFAQVRYQGLRCVLEPVPGQPLAASIIASLVDDLKSDDSTAWQLDAIAILREKVWSGVWVPRANGLQDPAPSIWQHARSWLPGGGFLAVDGTPGRVLSASSAPLKGLEPRPGSVVLHSPATGRGAWVVDAVKGALGAQSSSLADPVREPIDAYGTDQAIEIVAVPLSYDSDTRPAPDAVVECVACGLRHARPACPRCHMSVAPLVVADESRGDLP